MDLTNNIGNRIFVTGGAGFIGSSVVDRLLQDGHEVVAFDNFSTGQDRFLSTAHHNTAFSLVRGDLLDTGALQSAMSGCDFVFHFAANADVRFGVDNPRRDLEQNTIATFNVLEAVQASGIKRMAFSSTGSVYGESEAIPTPENAPFPVQTSLYGASKVAGEAMIQAWCEGFGLEATIFRFVSLLGERYTHGHVVDFYAQLLQHPDQLRVLGDGTQRKSYLYIGDCLNAMMGVISQRTTQGAKHNVQIYNLGTTEYCELKDSIAAICEHLGLQPRLEFSGGSRGWIGDNPFIFLDTAKVRATGWEAKLTIREGIIKTISWLEKNQWAAQPKA